jgi:hypothetical protein
MSREPTEPIVVSQWTIVGSVAVKTRSMSIAQKVAAQRTDARSGTANGVDWLDLDEYTKRTA